MRGEVGVFQEEDMRERWVRRRDFEWTVDMSEGYVGLE